MRALQVRIAQLEGAGVAGRGGVPGGPAGGVQAVGKEKGKQAEAAPEPDVFYMSGL